MRRIIPILLPMLLLLGGLCYGQSLGEAARQLRQQKQKDGTAAKKVFTTDDLSTTPDPKPADPKPDSPNSTKKDIQPPEQYKTIGMGGTYTPETWARIIKAQKDWIAHLQAEADKLKTPPKFDLKKAATDPEAKKYWEERGIQEQMASQIPEQTRKLEEMQDQARKAGMPATVYDPQ